jgi:hypothetical protein
MDADISINKLDKEKYNQVLVAFLLIKLVWSQHETLRISPEMRGDPPRLFFTTRDEKYL